MRKKQNTVILTKENLVLCISCNSRRILFTFLTNKINVLTFVKNREINNNLYKLFK
jgi:hypothetical protein